MPRIKYALFSIIFLSPFCGYTQYSKECEAILQQKIELDDPLKILGNINELTKCGLDSFDVSFIVKPALLSVFITNWEGKGGAKPLYRDYLAYTDKMRNMPEYAAQKQNMMRLYAILDRKADDSTWTKDTGPLLELGFTKEELAEAREMMRSKQYERLTYREVLFEYTSVKKSIAEAKQINESNAVKKRLMAIKATYAAHCDTSAIVTTNYDMLAFQSYAEGLKCAQKMKRKVLLYFTGKNCINARKMESAVFQKEEVRNLLESTIVLVDLPCDDRTEVKPEDRRYSKVLKAEIEKVGDINVELEMEKFDAEYQPYFVLLNKDGKVLAKQSYTKDIREFKAFLKNGN